MLQGQGKDARERGPSLPDGLTALGALPKRTITPFIKKYVIIKTNQLEDTRKYSDTEAFSDIVSISRICSQEHSIKINDFINTAESDSEESLTPLRCVGVVIETARFKTIKPRSQNSCFHKQF